MVVYWERYQETPSGWRLKPRPAPQLSEKMMQAEIDRAVGEISEFIDGLLPAIAARDPEIFTAHLQSDPMPWTKRLRTIGEWQSAARTLRGVLNAELTPIPRVLELKQFKRFIWAEPSIDYAVDEDRIRWQITCFAVADWLTAAHMYFRRVFGWPPKDESHPGFSIDATKRWFLVQPAQDSYLWNALTGVLPSVASHDPDFAMRMLDTDEWRRRIESNSALSPSQRHDELGAVSGSLMFRNVIHNALVHVIAALANNRFTEIGRFIDHPEFSGRYTPLVPHYLFANLLAKVHTLQQLCPNKGKYGPNRRFLGWTQC
jgi:hypothetical protein